MSAHRLVAHIARAVLLALAIGCRQPERMEPSVGQWVWTAGDARRFHDAQRLYPDLQAGLWAGTIGETRGRLVAHLGVPPAPLDLNASRVVRVVRIETSVARRFDAHDDSTVAHLLGERIRALLNLSGPDTSVVQLDFDAPERLLPRWASVVRRLRDGPLRGREVWITSIPAHVRHEEYGRWFRGAVDGHVLQVFDTGESHSERRVARLVRLAHDHDLPFQLGVASFERSLGARGPTTHRAWFAEVPRFSSSPWYRGLWVFPAGTAWTLYAAGTS